MSGALKQGGVIGDAPDLKIPPKGDLTHKIDFRQAYATVLDKWMETKPETMLG